MPRLIGNSGAPRWYDMEHGRLRQYIEHVRSYGATATEIVLHHGDADEFTRRVHVLQRDWDRVFQTYRENGLDILMHGPLTPDFALARASEDREHLLAHYEPVLDAAAAVAEGQKRTTIVLHGASHPDLDRTENERLTARMLDEIANRLARRNGDVAVAIELRARKEGRSWSAATSRRSILRILEQTEAPLIGICWDVAHDVENARSLGIEWVPPDDAFLNRVVHLHLHDIGPDGEPHCPLVYGTVPITDAMELSAGTPAILEIRWHMAERIGPPWEILAECYRRVGAGERI